MRLDLRRIEAQDVAEVFITAIPDAELSGPEQAEQLFSAITAALVEQKAHIVQERILACTEAFGYAPPLRAGKYGTLDDGVPPTWLEVPIGITGEISGVQVHAISGCERPDIVKHEGAVCGRIVRTPGHAFMTLSGITAPQAGSPHRQAEKMLQTAESLIAAAQIDLQSVPRTWMWLRDILSWYDDFNEVRNRHFAKRGLIGRGSSNAMPASTGIGIGPHGSGACAMDLTGIIEPKGGIEYFDVGGEQNSAFEYGSAFSRATRAATPAGTTVYVSGTASIDREGNTTHIDDAEGQIANTIANVRAVLKDAACRDEDVVQLIAYCKTAEIEKLFCGNWPDLPFPCITTIADVCRDDLLFEIEATAAKKG